MKGSILAAILAVFMASQNVKADPANAAKLTDEQKRQIAWAIEILAEAKALYPDQNQCAQFDPDIIQELRNMGLLNEGKSHFTSVCIGKSAQ